MSAYLLQKWGKNPAASQHIGPHGFKQPIWIFSLIYYCSVFPCSSEGKESAALQETWVRFLGQKDPLEKETETLSSILAWKIPWTQEPGRLQSMGSQELDTTK